MKIIVTGGRDFHDGDYVNKCLTSLLDKHVITHLVHGDALGVDSLAAQWAISNNITELRYPADWEAYGAAAGPIRNSEMLESEPDIELCVAFDGGVGTNDMVRKCRKAGIARVFFNKPISLQEELTKWG